VRSGLDCATYPVPVDHADPDGETVPLAIVRHRATDPDERLGALFVNPGGPGAPASDLVRAIGTAGDLAFVSPEIAARYDVIGMDPRGIGGSGGVRCLTDEQREAVIVADLDPTIPGGLPLPELQEQASTLREGCAANVDPELLGAMATDAVARDMDLVRAALGEEEIAYLGVSYGTLLGATYATLFPERVARMVLDAPVDPVLWREDPLQAAMEQTLSAEQQLDSWLQTCRAEGAEVCPFGAGDPERAFDALVARLEAQPLDVPASPAGPAGTLDGAATLIAARLAVFDRRLWPVLTTGLLAAEAGDGSVLVGLSQALVREPDGSPNGLVEGNVAVNCLDRAVPGELARHEANALAAQQAAPRFGELSGYLFLSCIDWPGDDPSALHRPAHRRGRRPGPGDRGPGGLPDALPVGRGDDRRPGRRPPAHPRRRRARLLPDIRTVRGHRRGRLPDQRAAAAGRYHLPPGAPGHHFGRRPADRRLTLSLLRTAGAEPTL
jgi:pimeloyl-ACP methyl ester carboxylesterase